MTIPGVGRLTGKASFSRCGQYRYSLRREWNPSAGHITFIGLNPSTANAQSNDPTIRRCIGLSNQWGYGGLEIVNLFAFRTPSPQTLKQVPDPVGHRNNVYLRQALRNANKIVLIWGNHGTMLEQDQVMLKKLRDFQCYCVGVTDTGAPRHPLYVKNGSRLKIFKNSLHGKI